MTGTDVSATVQVDARWTIPYHVEIGRAWKVQMQAGTTRNPAEKEGSDPTFKFQLLGCPVDDITSIYIYLTDGLDCTWNTRQPTSYSLQLSWTRHHLISNLARTTLVFRCI